MFTALAAIATLESFRRQEERDMDALARLRERAERRIFIDLTDDARPAVRRMLVGAGH